VPGELLEKLRRSKHLESGVEPPQSFGFARDEKVGPDNGTT